MRPEKIIVIVSIMLVLGAGAGVIYPAGINASNSQHSRAAIPFSSSGTYGNITFTGNVSKDFSGHLLYYNYNTSAWGPGNNVSYFYAAYNSTELFIGLIAAIGSGNNLMVYLSNNSGMDVGTYNQTNLNVYPRNINFTDAVNYLAVLPSGASATSVYLVKTRTTVSNSAPMAYSISNISKVNGTNVEIAIPFTSLFPHGFYSTYSFSMAAFIVGGSGGWVGTGIPFIQAGKYSDGTVEFEVNNTLKITISAPGSGFGNIVFTGNVSKDFAGHLVYTNYNATAYGAAYNNMSAMYLAYNSTDLFIGIQEFAKGNSLIVYISNNTHSSQGTYNASTLNTWNRNLLFDDPVNYFAAVYFSGTSGPNTGPSGQNAYIVTSQLSRSNTSSTAVSIPNTFDINSTAGDNCTEIAIPLKGLYPNGYYGTDNLSIAAFIVGGTNGSYVGVGIPYPQATKYGANVPGGYFTVNDTLRFTVSDINIVVPPHTVSFKETGLRAGNSWSVTFNGITASSTAQYINFSAPNGIYPFTVTALGYSAIPAQGNVTVNGAPVTVNVTLKLNSSLRINLNIIFNDHQPLYSPIGYSYWMLPWTAVHLEEYSEQAIIIHEFPTVNITYSLSGSLLYQIEAIAHGFYNNSYIMAAYIPQSQWNNTLYQEITQYNDTFLEAFATPNQWNSTTVRDVLEFNLAFNTPLWVYSSGTPAGNEYKTLFSLEQTGVLLNNQQLTDALVEFFLWSVSYPEISGMLGSQYINSTLWNLYNQTSFNIGEIRTITAYYPVEAQRTLSVFKMDMELNSGTGGNVELLTTPFDHPILPLLLMDSWTGGAGDQVVKGVWANDTLAQLNIGRDIFYDAFGQYPVGLWSPEQAVDGAIVPYLNETGYKWTSSADATLNETGLPIPSGSSPTAQEMETLYQPYEVVQNNTSVVMVFRDSTLSNDWGFNYGAMAETSGNWAPVNAFIDYLKNVYETVPAYDHNNITVTVALDGENWMFMSPFPVDGVPFLQDLYLGLEQNSSWIHTITMQQYLSSPHAPMPVITNLPVGSWNEQGVEGNVSPFLTQWAGHEPQDASWQQLALVRSMVQAYGEKNGLVQPMNLTQLESSTYYPYYDQWNLTTPQERYDRAWLDIYGAEGSDIYFTFDPADQSLTSQNAIVFEFILRYDLTNALKVLGLPLTPWLAENWTPPLTPTVWGDNSSVSPQLTGSLYNVAQFGPYSAYSVNNNYAWKGAYEYRAHGPSNAMGINTVYYAFDPNNLYFAVSVNGPTREYAAPNAYSEAPLDLQIYLSMPNPGVGDLAGLSVADAAFQTTFGAELGFAATYMVTIVGTSVTPSGSAQIALYQSYGYGSWSYLGSYPDAYVGSVLQIQIPMKAIGMLPSNSITFSVATVNATSGQGMLAGPLNFTVPASLSKLTLISVIHNTAPSNGPGNYTYPTLTQDYPPNSVQMRWVNVSVNAFIVQFNITFGNLTNPFGGAYGFTQPIIDIYIHEGSGAGNTAMLPGPNAEVAPAFAWQWVIQADGFPGNAYVENYQGTVYTSSMIITSNLTTKTVSIQVPLSLIGSNIPSYGYVIIAGFQDGYATNGWDPVNIGPASDYQGGGAANSNAPNIFSYIAPNAVNSSNPLTQQKVLSNYTTTHLAVLPGIYLPLITPTKTVSTSLKPELVTSGMDTVNSMYMSFYDINNTVYWSSSSNGEVWSSPSILMHFSPHIVAMSFYSSGGLAYLLVSTPGAYSVFNLTSGVTVTNFSLSTPAVSASLFIWHSSYYVVLATGTEIEVMSSSGTVLGTTSSSADNISSYANASNAFVAYASGSSIYLSNLTLGSSVTFGAPESVVSAPSNSSIGQLSLAVNNYGQIIVTYIVSNSTGTNVFLSFGTPGNMTTRQITSDGLDLSPSTIISVSGYSTSVIVSFANTAQSGNVYFIPTPVASFTFTPHQVAPSPVKKTTAPYSLFGIVLIIVAVVVLVIGVGVYIARERRKKQ